MGQTELMNVLATDPDRWWSAAEIMAKLDKGRNTILKGAGQLAHYDLIDSRWDSRWNGYSNKPVLVFKAREERNLWRK